MARSPLFRLFSRALRSAALAKRHKMPVDELPELNRSPRQPQRSRLGRRKFLKTAAAFSGGTMLALSGDRLISPLLAREHAPPKIAIVGAGIAGLTAGYYLKKAGYRATIYEASNRVGGRMYTVKDVVGKDVWVNLGAEYINSDHEDIIALAEEFQIPLLDRFVPEEMALRELYHFDGREISESELGEALLPIVDRIAADADRLEEDWENASIELDALSVSEYCDRLGITGWLRKFIDVVMIAEMGLEPDEITALNLIWQIPAADAEGKVEPTGDSDERFLVQNGTQSITDAIARELQDQIKTGMHLNAIRDRNPGFTLTFNYKDIDADIVILAIPFSVLRQVRIGLTLPKKLNQFIGRLGHGTNVKVAVGYDKWLWREQGLSGQGFSDAPFQSFFETTQLQSTETGSLTFYLGGKTGVLSRAYSVRENARLYTKMLDRLIPNLAKTWNGKATRLHWPSYNYARCSYACWKPRQYTEFVQDYVYLEGEYEQECAYRNLIFAGEHTSDEYQGFMNGGAQSGRLAAKAVLTRLNAPVSAI
ncbi:MAG: FAD-dependent oxidoreductase [Spirulina sp.]